MTKFTTKKKKKFFVFLLQQRWCGFLLTKTNLPYVHYILFLSAYARSGNLLNTLSTVFPESIRLGYDSAHCHVCSCEDSLPAGTCRQWPASGDLLPLLKCCPSSLPWPCFRTRNISDLLCVPSTPSTSILSLWASISPSCNHSATRNVKLPICVPEACKHHCSVSETLNIISVLGKKGKAAKAASESQSPDKNMQFYQGHAKSTSLAHVWTA